MDNLAEIIITGSVSAGSVGTILGYFLKRVIADIDDLQVTINGKLGVPGLVTQVQLNTQNDEKREEAFEKLEKAFQDHIKNNPHKEINKAIDALRKEVEDKYRKK